MKLLLTSAGLTNKSIINELSKLVVQPFGESNCVFIPTAANIEPGDKEWLKQDMNRFKDLQLKKFNVVDIANTPKEKLPTLFEEADIIIFGGGNAYYLMTWIIKSGTKDYLPDMLRHKTYVGISAGSMVTTTYFYPTFNHDIALYDEEIISEEEIKYGLSLVDFHIIPHLNSPIFPKVRSANLTKFAEQTTDRIYAIDDNTAVKVVDSNISVISEGKWEKLN